MDVLDLDRRVVDQNADRQRQAAERHHVERMAQGVRAATIEVRIDSGIETGDDQRAAPASEEQQDHGGRSSSAGDDALVDHAFDRRPRRTATDRTSSSIFEALGRRRADLPAASP